MNSVPCNAFLALTTVAWSADFGARWCALPAGIRRGDRHRRLPGFAAVVWRFIASFAERATAESAAPSVSEVDWSDIRATLEGSNDAYARIVTRYQQTIGAQMWRFTQSPAVYEDLVHDVFVEAYLSLPR